MCVQGPAAVQCTAEHPASKQNCSRKLRATTWVVNGNPRAGEAEAEASSRVGEFSQTRHQSEGRVNVSTGDFNCELNI